jgi:CRISPR system Cascade subunit CasE
VYLSRLILNLRNRQVRTDIARPYEMHRSLMHAFPDDLTASNERLLFRIENDARSALPIVLVQSQLAPNWSKLPPNYFFAGASQPNPQVKEINLTLHTGQLLAFRLVANPTKRLSKSIPQAR